MTNAHINMTAPMAQQSPSTKAVYVCDTQPITAVGIRALLGDHSALSFRVRRFSFRRIRFRAWESRHRSVDRQSVRGHSDL
jgi:hypothetical protein